MPKSVGLLESAVTVEVGHLYGGTLEGALGPVSVHDGDTVDAPVIVRLRDSKRTFFWEPTGDSGDRTLLFSGWPGQKGLAFTLLDMGTVKKHPTSAVA